MDMQGGNHSASAFVEYLRRKDTSLATVMDSIFDGVYIVDETRRIVFWNEGAERITGFSWEEVRGRRCSENILNHIDENGTLLCLGRCPLAKTLITGEPIEAKVYPRHKSGRRFPVKTHVAPLRDEQGHIVAAIEVFRDISDQEAYRVLQEKFQRAIKGYVSSQTFEEAMKQATSDRMGGPCVRDLTILHLDIVGFTAFSERHPPEAITAMLNNVFGVCEVITRACHGDIDKFIGDAMMAVFVDANDAVDAAERILHALANLNRLRHDAHQEPVHVRIGINSGMVVQGDIGTRERKDLTVIGDAVNTAEQIQSLAPIDSVAISEATWSRLVHVVAKRFAFYHDVAVKGRQQPIAIFLPEWHTSEPTTDVPGA